MLKGKGYVGEMKWKNGVVRGYGEGNGMNGGIELKGDEKNGVGRMVVGGKRVLGEIFVWMEIGMEKLMKFRGLIKGIE